MQILLEFTHAVFAVVHHRGNKRGVRPALVEHDAEVFGALQPPWMRRPELSSPMAVQYFTLVVAPATVLDNWLDEIDKWHEHAAYGTYKVSAEESVKKRLAVLREWQSHGGSIPEGLAASPWPLALA